MATPAGSRYRDIAERLEQALRNGTYAPGQRLPSVRDLCRNWNASITTVVAAYRLLEQRGLIEARPQSGHFAKRQDVPPAPLPRPRFKPTTIALGPLALEVMRAGFDERLVPFAAALPDPALLPSRELDRTIIAVGRAASGSTTSYGVPPGSPALRQAIARRAAGFGCALDPAAIVTTAGALEALTLALRATCRAGQTVAIESPMYYGLLQSIEALGLHVIEIPSDLRRGISLELLRDALDEHPIAAVVAMPAGGNPTGSLADDHTKCELVELLTARDIPLIEDDVLGDLVHDGSRPRPAKAFDREGQVLWCSSLSKTAGPGLRLGWIAAGRWQAAVEHLQFTNAIGPSPLIQEIAARFLADGAWERGLRKARTIYGERTAAMADSITAAFPAGTRVIRPSCGFSVWVELPAGNDAQKLQQTALAAGIAIAPGTLFSARKRHRHCIRLAAARWDDSQAAAIRRLAKLVAS
jgi:DNA-binding transcriptional MocR family regulator